MTTLLILDDEPIIRQSLVDYFEDQEWNTLEAESAETALTLLKNHEVTAAIVDIRLPGLDGNEFIRRAVHLCPRMGFVICTGSPAFIIPADLSRLSNVSSWLCRKPVRDLSELKHHLVHLLDNLKS